MKTLKTLKTSRHSFSFFFLLSLSLMHNPSPTAPPPASSSQHHRRPAAASSSTHQRMLPNSPRRGGPCCGEREKGSLRIGRVSGGPRRPAGTLQS